MTDEQELLPSQWCLVGNIVQERSYGPGGHEVRRGTAHFSPGTKVYCLPAQWGDGYERIMVIGRHRGSKEWVTMVINAAWVTNWRAKVVYEPAVLRRLHAAARDVWRWTSREAVEAYVADLQRRRTDEQNTRSESDT